MINFFRNIRKRLANENKFQRYMRYAIGEALLIMLGIFMALQLQNWNEKRKQETRFKATLDQLYTTINYDAEVFDRHSIIFKDHYTLIDKLLYYPDSIQDQDLPFILFYFSLNEDSYRSESLYHTQQLNYDPDNKEQKEIAKEVVNYINTIANYKYWIDERLEKAVKDIDISKPKVNLNNVNGNWDRSDSTYYSTIDLKNLHDLIRTHSFRAILKSVRTDKIWNYQDARNWYNDGISIRSLIKTYYPEVKEFYKNVGIIGTSINGFDDVGAKSTPMILTDKDQNIWELDLYLKVGRVKFRCRDSWAQNWGAETFPNGIGTQYGSDIPIPEAGNYHIIFKPVTGEYEFIKQVD